jgi:hypothetical protein
MLLIGLADVVMPVEDKRAIGQRTCNRLMMKIRADLQRNIEEVAVYVGWIW